MIRLEGRPVADAMKSQLIPRVEKFLQKTGRAPHLTVVLVGEDPASQVYVRNKHEACQKVGMRSTVVKHPASLSEKELIGELQRLNQDPQVDAVLVQLPFPKHISPECVAEFLDPHKDADALTYTTMGRLLAQRSQIISCTPRGVMRILSHYGLEIKGRQAVVVGRSLIVGKPMFHLLTDAQATVTLCHSQTTHLRQHTQAADIVVVAAGKPRFLGRDDFKKGSIVIDVGIHRGADGKLCGDVRFEELEGWVYAASPAPGGVGPLTIASLLENTMILAEQREGL